VHDAQTMHNRGVPYHVGRGWDGGRMDINSGGTGVATLTIQPGVTILFAPGGVVNVAGRSSGTNGPALGALSAIGVPCAPIVFTSDQGAVSAAGNWLGIWVGDPVDERTVMQNVKVMFAGGADVLGSNSCPYSGPGLNNINDAAIRILGCRLARSSPTAKSFRALDMASIAAGARTT
jgi:hypothetical protein